MKDKISRTVMILFAVVFMFSSGLAQRTTQTGLLNGTVVDDEGTSLPGVTVVASSPSLMLPQVSTITDAEGFFRLPQLPPGIYKVVFELGGFKKVVREGIKISIGTTSLNITMEPSPIEETVTVIGQGPTVNMQDTSLGVNLDQNLLRHIPVARLYTSVFEMAPGVVSDGGRPASHGSTVRDNAFNVDGVIINCIMIEPFLKHSLIMSTYNVG